MNHRLVLGVGSLVVATVLGAGCEDSSDSGPGATFDAGGFDGNGNGADALAPGSDATPDDSADAGDGGEGGVTPPPPTVNDVYVDPTAGLDTNTGKSGSPFKTLTKAFSVVPAGAGVHLLDGTYDSTNEGGTTRVKIPADVNVRSENPGKATITNLIVQTTGGATAVYDVVFTIGTELDALGTTKLLGANLTFLPNTYFSIVNVNDSAETTLVGGTLDGTAVPTPAIGAGLFEVTGTGTLTLDGTVMRNLKAVGVRLYGPALTTKAKLVVKNNAVFDNVYNAILAANDGTATIDHATFKNSTASAVSVAEGSDVTITNSTFIQNFIAVNAPDGLVVTDNTFVKIATSTFTNNPRGIDWRFAAGHIDVSDTTFTSVAMPSATTTAIGLFAGAPALSAIIRRTTIHGYDNGIDVATQDATLAVDLGTAVSPGKNDFSQNFRAGVYDELAAGVVLDAQGNTWNPNIQGADAAGHYPAGTTSGTTNGTNYTFYAVSTLNL